jgi:hypothetical protein
MLISRSHVRRFEALRRASIVERIDADHWRIPDDFEQRAAGYDVRRSVNNAVRVLSTLDLEQQIGSDRATWLDRELASPSRTPSWDSVGGQLGYGEAQASAGGHGLRHRPRRRPV